MNLRRHFLEAATLIVAAILCALLSNAMATRERKMALVGSYPNALKVPTQSTDPLPATSSEVPAATASATIALQPATTAPLTMTMAPVTQTAPTAKANVPHTTSTTTSPDAAPFVPAAAAKSTSAADVIRRFPAHPDKPYLEVGYDDVAALHDAGVLFLDARRTSFYEQDHVAGARPFSVWESDIDDKVRKLFDERSDPAQQVLPIVIYCSGGECEDSHMLAQKLWGIQFNNICVYRDGFPDWQKHGGAVHTGTTP